MPESFTSHAEVIATETNTGKVWQMVGANDTKDPQDPPEELVFTIHGIIMLCDLPPVTRPYGRFVSVKALQQRILLTGLNTPSFADALEGLAVMDNVLRLNVREDSVKPLASVVDGFTALDISNRYFTSRRFAQEDDHLPFSSDVDPNGILEGLRGHSMVHTSDNVVEYYHRVETNSGYRFNTIRPAQIKKGDIVEIQCTLTLIEFRANDRKQARTEYSTKLVLRSITLLDRTFSEKARLANVTMTKSPSLKRRIGHFEEEEKETQERIKRMAIDKET
ncbi:hypothetical protein VNI00_018070 [Paramarasmius palmivorus]|uniref:Uncharacterized protein n=1 Tax=Paramarasmius palmivorus TaxID=297713 RepID=A0AAW0B1J8_9AGAR